MNSEQVGYHGYRYQSLVSINNLYKEVRSANYVDPSKSTSHNHSINSSHLYDILNILSSFSE